jgi:hypothetical protein
MTKIFSKAVLATTLAATALTAASPAMADTYRGGYNRDRGDSTGAAIAGGIIGLALGAIIVSASSNKHNRYRDRGWSWRDGYYWDREGNRYDRDGRPSDQDGYYSRRGYGDRGDRGYDGRGYDGRRGNWDNRGYDQGDRGYYGREGYYGDRNYRSGH